MTEPWHCNDGMAFPIRRHRSLASKGFSTATQRRGFSLRSIVDAGSGIVDARPPGAYRLTIALQKQRSRCWALRRIAILTISLHCFAQWPLRRRAHHQEKNPSQQTPRHFGLVKCKGRFVRQTKQHLIEDPAVQSTSIT
ncbi:uncharacterized protein PV07_02249 [Cladophialophora immunda]|uniref:Uncharacterized protein n=1 Tax=Cladophialophora immunda TaxID=569365 RepID=A0A0D2DIQ9_9EURO|nr:uncharacterized protein PV07_02249 [Cladophialophora immunda]KIW35559.1 hypothetical protein PV07_02249 [Cladophialophora immunda]